MKTKEREAIPNVTGMHRRMLTKSEATRITDGGFGSGTCTHQMAYKTGNYKKTTIYFITWSEVEYYCPLCKETFTNLELF